VNKNLLLLGAGGHGGVVYETAEAMDIFDKIAFLDDNSELAIGKCEDYRQYINDFTYAFPAIGNNELRMKWIIRLTKAGFKLPVLIHPTAFISPSTKVYNGCIVEAKAVVNTNTVIENGCIIGIGAMVDHDCHINEGVHINVGAIIKSSCNVEKLSRIDAGIIFDGAKGPKETE
jgi:UDP-N-acetylbacillosamine N-acetyltransferase